MTNFQDFLNHILVRIYLKCLPKSYWHNRHYIPYYKYSKKQASYKKETFVLKNLEDIRSKGKRVNILASGPSVSTINHPKKLFTDFLMTMNGSFQLVENLGSKWDVYLVTDYHFIIDNYALFQRGVLGAQWTVLEHKTFIEVIKRDSFFLKDKNIILVNLLLRPYLQHRHYEQGKEGILCGHGVCYSRNPHLGFYGNGTVVISAVQLAEWLGFKEVYIFGMDLNTSARFYKEQKPIASQLLDYKTEIENTFALLGAQKDRPTLFNCSLISQLQSEWIQKTDPNVVLRI